MIPFFDTSLPINIGIIDQKKYLRLAPRVKCKRAKISLRYLLRYLKEVFNQSGHWKYLRQSKISLRKLLAYSIRPSLWYDSLILFRLNLSCSFLKRLKPLSGSLYYLLALIRVLITYCHKILELRLYHYTKLRITL